MAKLLHSRVTTVVLIALVAIFGIHVVTQAAQNVRVDMTADDLYSLSEGTRDILDRMKREGVKPIEVSLYFSETTGKTLPRFIKDFISYNRYVRALLQEYEVAAGGKIEVQFIDPLPDSDEAQDATDFGLDGKPINQHGDLFFFGLVFETQTGSKDVIDFLWPNRQETIEYEISKRIHSLIWPTRQRVGILSSLEILSDTSNPYMAQILAAQGKQPQDSWLSMKLLEESYDVSTIDKDTDRIDPEAYDLVTVVHPKELSGRALWALDEWITRGGNTAIFLDPYSLGDTPPQNPQQPWLAMQYKPSSNLEPLLSAWGLERTEDRIAADFDLAVTRATSRLGGAERLVYDLAIDDRHLADTVQAGHPIVQGISDLRFFLAGSLQPSGAPASSDAEGDAAGDGAVGVPGVTLTPLVTTTAKGNTIEVQAGFGGDGGLVFADLNDAGKVRDRYTEGTEPVNLAMIVQGKLPSAYPQGATLAAEPPPAPPPGMPPGMQMPPATGGEMVTKEPVPEDQRAEATVVVFADVDLISDQVAFQSSLFGVQAANDNYKLLLNTVDYLLGADELMKVRAKNRIQRPFTRFDDIEAEADRATLDRERELRQEIAQFEEQLREKNSGLGQSNAALFQKQLQDEVDELNGRMTDANRELRDIRLEKRRALEKEEARVRRATLFTTPILVLVLGLALFFRRKSRDARARRGA